MNRVAALRVSLLISMGIVPGACGGTTRGHDPDTGEGGGGSGSQAGMPAHGGTKATTGGTGVTTGGTGVVTGGTTSIAGAGGAVGFRCSAPKVDPRTGLVSCKEGFVHRPTARLCGVYDDGAAGRASDDDVGAGGGPSDTPIELPRATGNVKCGPSLGDAGAPNEPDICRQFEYGYCNTDFEGDGLYAVCLSGCAVDADCGNNQICVCNAPASPTGGSCRPANCKTDKDCGGSLCASYQQVCGGTGFSCLTSQDECSSNADCAPGGTCSPGFEITGDPKMTRRQCEDGVACGRPFLVQERARVAPLAHGSSWRSGERLTPQTQHLTSAERASLAAHWSYLGQLEHASIAAFARFSLQLLALGAPPDLVEACTQALADETAHTKLCFELASAYAGRAIGPGPLDIAGSLEGSSLVDVVDLVLAEGCFGETGAALEAFEAAEGAADPVIAAAYARIAADEQRHAELAFRFVRWALERGGRDVAARIAAAIATPPSTSAATRDVTLPCLAALLEAYGAATRTTPAQTAALAC